MTVLVAFGEVMMRLSPPGFLRLTQATTLDVTFGGAEVNVAVALSQWDVETTFVTRLPANDLGQACLNQIRGLGVDTRSILRGGDRIGVYYVEQGAAQRAPAVLYDRARSAIADVDPADLDWPAVLTGAHAFHFTGITPALSPGAAQATLDGARTAREMGLFVSCDLNYRSKLWSREAAGETMCELLPYVDLCLASEEDAATMFGIPRSETGFAAMAERLTERFPNLKTIGMSERENTSASRNGWEGLLVHEGVFYRSRRYDIEIVERIGSGDVFAAGLIYGHLNDWEPQRTIEFATAASCLKHSIRGDYSCVKRAEVEALVESGGAARVQR